MLLRLDNKTYSDQPAPNRETLLLALDETYRYCELLSRELRKAKRLDSYPSTSRFLSNCFVHAANRLLAIKKLGSTFRNEAFSLHRSAIEIVVDASWIWYYFDFDHKPDIAERICRQFFLNSPAKFISEFNFIKQLYPREPFVKEYFDEDKLDSYLKKAKEKVGSYKYQSDWRYLGGFHDKKKMEWKWQDRCKKAGIVMEKLAKLKNADIYRNLSILSAYTHWDSFQTQYSDENIEEAIFDKNLNAVIGIMQDLIQLGYSIIEVTIPEELRISRQRIIW